ncbi:hypothetical protein HYT02_05220 [Candidatus Gottesmanbacteria bacterium]|nr:hypothetical protein [Candidatus Gottesmanbacteria bacterium]
MTLPKVKKKKLIKKDFIELAKKVQKSFEEEAKYLIEKREKNGDILSIRTHNHS